MAITQAPQKRRPVPVDSGDGGAQTRDELITVLGRCQLCLGQATAEVTPSRLDGVEVLWALSVITEELHTNAGHRASRLVGTQLPAQLRWRISAINNYIRNPVGVFVGDNYPRDHPGG